MMTQLTTDQKTVLLTWGKAVSVAMALIAITHYADKFYYEGENQKFWINYNAEAAKRRVANEAERTDYKLEVQALEFNNKLLQLQLSECQNLNQ